MVHSPCGCLSWFFVLQTDADVAAEHLTPDRIISD